jgi:hypothetical protein
VYCPLGSWHSALGMEGRVNWDGGYLMNLGEPAPLPSPGIEMVKVGLVWAGSPSEMEDRKRSISLKRLIPLRDIRGVNFFNLQKGWAAREVHGAGFAITDLSDRINDFADTAAFVAQMDLIISVDTAVAHLAGAMGKAVWTLLPFVPHWKWGTEGEHTAWYPTMRLFRQKKRGDWDDVIQRVASELKEMVGT